MTGRGTDDDPEPAGPERLLAEAEAANRRLAGAEAGGGRPGATAMGQGGDADFAR